MAFISATMNSNSAGNISFDSTRVFGPTLWSNPIWVGDSTDTTAIPGSFTTVPNTVTINYPAWDMGAFNPYTITHTNIGFNLSGDKETTDKLKLADLDDWREKAFKLLSISDIKQTKLLVAVMEYIIRMLGQSQIPDAKKLALVKEDIDKKVFKLPKCKRIDCWDSSEKKTAHVCGEK